ncbi:MAG TPA: methyltransferase domain-containing protein [Gemmatimonadales bacterium]|jgi:SAM-dependent methyltransferase|nr:methyltransferase domain-containing protein [Gemmatimonadales bacterium]
MAEWFEEWFNEEYLALYPHRDDADAGRLVAALQERLPWHAGIRVLDVACGPGRHARAFEDAGADCIGVDLSMALLRRAQLTSSAPLIRADMRALPIRPGSMDLTVNLFTSFGYFDSEDEHQSALSEMVATVRPGGWFVLDFLNSDLVRRSLVAHESLSLHGTPIEVNRRLTDTGRFVCKSLRSSDGRSWFERVRLFDADELEAMLMGAGVTVRFRMGDYNGALPGPAQPRLVLGGQVGI